MGQHKQALQIYVFQLQEVEKAEDYCNRTYLASTLASPSSPSHAASDTSSIYLSLLALYLEPPSPYEPNIAAALSLLSRHGARLPAPETLDLIPDGQSVRQLERFLKARIRAVVADARMARLTAALEGVWGRKVNEALMVGEEQQQQQQQQQGEGDGGTGPGLADCAVAGTGAMPPPYPRPPARNRHVLITEERHCVVCFKRFGGSAIRVYPDGTVVHYGCVGRGVGRKKIAGGGERNEWNS